MPARETIAERFEIESVAGQGGMGTVYRARDLSQAGGGGIVALKVVRGTFANARFEREARLLSQIAGEGIVGYVAHGRIDAESMFLAMEWLEGEGLDARLARGGALAISDCIVLGRRIARALAIAHAECVVHRDVKPSNVILRDGRVDRAMLVDFGIARAAHAHMQRTGLMTATGAVLGTPQYMAPEQARGESGVDARADVFSLGCVLFECLTGRAAFVGAHAIAVLAKILLEPAGRASELRPEVPAALDDLVLAMLDKVPENRPRSGQAVADALDAIHAGDGARTQLPRAPAIGATERRLATVILAREPASSLPSDDDRGDDDDDGDDALEGLTREQELIDIASLAGVTLTALANGTLVGAVVMTEAGTSNAAERAAKCALALRAQLRRGATIALATGRAVVASQLPVGEAIDAAAVLLHHAEGIWVDEATASMIESGFALARTNSGISVTAQRAVTAIRTFMGREVACVGRARELALLESTFRECVDEPIARALLVIAPPGIGKTRLRRELTARVATWAADAAPTVWLALADPVMQGAPYALAGDLFRRALGPTQTDKFLGEIIGTPFNDDDDDDDDEVLRAARRSPELMRTKIIEAATAAMGAVVAKSPLLCIIEDVHWADVASVRLLGAVLDRLKDAPLMILALARPSIDEVHPRLWEEHRASRFVLEPLLPKAAEKLARAVLGDSADVAEIVRRAEGNPLFVEELTRVRAEGGSSDLPPTIAAAAEARLSALPPETRHVLRAASIVGERFWSGAVGHLVGSTLAPRVKTILDTLEREEVVSAEPTSRFVDDREYVFRHALVRDAAYAMLTKDDRVMGHGLTAEWLEQRAGVSPDAAVLAQHYELGDRRDDAARWHVAAAEDALAAADPLGISKHVASAESCAASGELLGRARLAQADIALWKGDNAVASRAAREAMALVQRGTARWFNAASIASVAFGKLEDTVAVVGVVNELDATPASSQMHGSGSARAIARIRAAIQLAYFGELARTDALLLNCEHEPGAEGDAGVLAWLCDAAYDRAISSGEPVHPARFLEGRELYRRIGDRRGAVVQAGNHLLTLAMIGAVDEALAIIPAYEREGAEIGFHNAKLGAAWARAACAAAASDVEPFLQLLPKMRAMMPVGRMSAGIGLALAELLVLRDRVDEAAEEVAIGLSASTNAPLYYGGLLAVSAMVKLRRKDVDGALADSENSMVYAGRAATLGSPYISSLVRFEALQAAGRLDEAKVVVRDAAALLTRRAASLGEYGPGYLERGWRNAELMSLARAQGVA